MLKKLKTIPVLLSLVVLLLVSSFTFKALNKEYLVDINGITTFNQISDGFVYFGRPTCSSCESFEPMLKEVVKEEKIQVYYFNIEYFRANSSLPEKELQEFFKKYKITQIPMLIKLEKGSLTSNFDASVLLEKNSENIKEQVRDYIKN